MDTEYAGGRRGIMQKRQSLIFVAIITLLIILAGCSPKDGMAVTTGANGGGDDASMIGASAKPPEVSTKPVTLKFYAHVAAMTPDDFQDTIAAPVAKKYPYISFEFSQGGRGNLDKLVASGDVPDIIFTGSENYLSAQQLGVTFDHSDLIKKFNIDLGRFVPSAVEAVRSLEGGKSMNAIPIGMNVGMTFYNKDIFDKFGISYPTNGMTWDQIVALSNRITRQEDGAQYIGWEPGTPDTYIGAFGMSLVDPKTNKANIDNDIYKKIFTVMQKAYQEPGHLGPKNDTTLYGPKFFINDKVIGMFTDWINKMLKPLVEADEKNAGPNWDMVTIPNFAENAGKGREATIQFLFATKSSNYKDQAIQVIDLVSSMESQTYSSRNGRIPILNDQQIEKQFGQDVPTLKGKHVENLFTFKPSPALNYSIYDDEIRKIIRSIPADIAVKGKDVNTALREKQAEADKTIAEMSK
jgi:multiple sugar transport system substrate-binding protein